MVAIAQTDAYDGILADDDTDHLQFSSSAREMRSVRNCIHSLFVGTDEGGGEERDFLKAYLENPENVDSPEWHEFVLSADRARKAALRLVLKNANKGGEEILENSCSDCASVGEDAQSTGEILDDVVRCLFALEAWKDDVLPVLSARIERERKEMMTQYLAKSKLLLHVGQLQSSILGVLEIAVFDNACSVGESLNESNLLDLVDYCVERLEALNNVSDPTEKSTLSENSDENDEYLCRTMSCLSILRSICDSVSELPLSVVARLISKHKIHSHLLPTLLSKVPWFRKEEQKVLNDGRWISAKSLVKMPKPEAQVWLCLRALLSEPVCSGRHDYHDSTFERSLIVLKSKLLGSNGNSRLIDQIPQLGGDGLQRAILYHLHEIQRNKRADVETTLFDAHVLTRNMNAMKKGEETCASENSKHEKETQKRSAFTLIQPIQSTSFRQTVHEKAKEDATRWVDAFVSRHSENFDVYSARVRQEVLNMFDEEYDVLDNIKSIATNTNDDLSEPQTSSAHTVRVQFLHNDNEEERMVQQELLYAFDARDADCLLPDADVVLSQKKYAGKSIDGTTGYVRGERFKCAYAGEEDRGKETLPDDDAQSKQRRLCSRSSSRWFSNPRYVRVSVERNDDGNDAVTTSTTTMKTVLPLKVTDLSRALDESDRNDTKGGGSLWIACGSLRADTFCVQMRLKCRRPGARRVLCGGDSHPQSFSYDDDNCDDGERNEFFSYDLSVARVVCCLMKK
jgi:hypothetical protein|tara:strand:- start:1100 stop:3319 length:2220 start_codon:yes stop_codon:yes gene_type:complete